MATSESSACGRGAPMQDSALTSPIRAKSTPPGQTQRSCQSVTPERGEGGRRLRTPDHGDQRWKSSSPMKRFPSNNSRLFSPVDSDQELNDLEVESVLADGPDGENGQCYRSSSKISPFRTPSKLDLSPFRPSTVMTNLQRGNVQTTTPSIIHNMTAHQMAAQGELIMLRQEIADGCDVNKTDSGGLTPIHWACKYGQQAAVELLVEAGADITIAGKRGENALLFASCYGYSDIVKFALQHGMDPNYTDEAGNTALMYAAYNNHASCIQILLEYGADLTMVNENQNMAYDLAAHQGHAAAQKAFEKYMLSLFEHPT